MTTPVYDCGKENCWACHHRFRTREGLTSIVLEEARAVVEAEKDLDKLHDKEFPDTGDEAGDCAVYDAHNENIAQAEQDMIAMVIRLSNALLALDAFTANSKAA